MQFKRLYMRNFLAVGSEGVEILFNKYNGACLIHGTNQDVPGRSSNGSGKSTIVEGVFFGLTGKTLRKLNNDAILHNSNSKQCRVEVEFDNVKIIRMLEPNDVKLFIDGVEKTVAGATRETKKLIDQIIGINFETLSNILIFGQHNMISFLDAPEAEKREIIENLMSIREYNAYEERARQVLKETKNQHKSLQEQHSIHETHCKEQENLVKKQEIVLHDFVVTTKREIATIDTEIEDIPDLNELKTEWENFNSHKDSIDKVNQSRFAISNQSRELSDNLEKLTNSKNTDQAGRVALVEKISTLQQKLPILESKKEQLWQNVVQLKRQKENLENRAKAAFDLAKARADALSPSSHWDSAISSANSLGSVCPTCHSKITHHDICKVVEKLEADKQADIQKVSAEKKLILDEALEAKVQSEKEVLLLHNEIEQETERQKNGYLATKNKLSQMITDAQSALVDFDASIAAKYDASTNSLNTQIVDLKKKLAKLDSEYNHLVNTSPPEPSVAVEDIGKLQSRLESLRKQRAQKEHSIDNNPHVDVIISLKDALDKTLAQKKDIEKQISEVETKIPYLEFWVEHMGKQGIKSFVIDQIIPTLNEQIEYWMGLIYQGTISVQFDKFFNVIMTNNSTGNPMVFGQGSGGERRRIDLAIMLAFRQVMKLSAGKDPSILFFDECIENLDEEGIYRFWDAIENISKDSTVFLITHNPTLLQLMQGRKTLEVIKKNGYMKLVS